MEEIELPESSGLHWLEARVFFRSGLKRFEARATLRTLERGAFAFCERLESVVLNEGLAELGQEVDAFAGVFEGSALRSVVLPSTLKVIRSGAFMKCAYLTSLQLPAGLEVLESYALSQTGIREIFLGAGLRALAPSAFDGCRRLKTVYLARGCGVSSRCFGPGVTVVHSAPSSIGNFSFQAIRALKAVLLPEGLQKVGSEWFLDSGVERVSVSASVVEIGRMAFSGCESLREVEFLGSSSLKLLGVGCFSNSGLTGFSVPGSVEAIGERAF